MERNFSADILVKVSKSEKKIVSIIPFSDSDKRIANTLEKVLNHALMHDNDVDFESFDCFRKLSFEV